MNRSHSGESWTSREDAQLQSAFYEGKSVDELADLHGRTKSAIASRLVRNGLLIVHGKAYYRVDKPWCDFKDTKEAAQANHDRGGGDQCDLPF